MKDFPLSFHAESFLAHTFAKCILNLAGQAAYFRISDKLFDTQSEWGGKGNEEAKKIFLKMAKDEKVSDNQMNQCLGDASIISEIQQDIDSGKSASVSGTPTIFIGKKIFPGVIGPDMIERAIQEENTTQLSAPKTSP